MNSKTSKPNTRHHGVDNAANDNRKSSFTLHTYILCSDKPM